MASTVVEFELDEFDTWELIEELRSREGYNEHLFIRVQTIEDEAKMEHFAKVFNKYTSSQIEQMLPA